MIGTLLWKEYREQRGLWLGLVILAFALSFGLGIALPPQGLAGLSQDPMTRTSILVMLVSFAVGYPLVCGALLLAGEREGGTWDFLHYSASSQQPVWRSKLGAGLLLTLVLTLLFGALAGYLNLARDPADRWALLAILPLVGLDALVWGLLASAWCRSVLGAVLAAIGLWTVSWMASIGALWIVGINFGFFIENGIVKLALAGLALTLSYRRYCRDEFDQRAAATGKRSAPSSMKVLIWLMFRQGRIELIALALLVLVASGFLAIWPLALWPLLSVTVGLICGFAVFGHEQARQEESVLGRLRLNPNVVWSVKVGFWLLVAATALTLAYVLAFATQDVRGRNFGTYRENLFSSELEYLGYSFNLLVFLSVWPVHGFCFGLLFSLMFRRTIVAVLASAMMCAVVLALWTPSLISGGLAYWQMFVIPGLLAIATRAAMWPWVSGRLLTTRSLASLLLVGVLCVGSLAGSLWYRATEIPDLGEPFDVAAYHVELDAIAKNPAGELLRQAAAEFKAWQVAVDDEIGVAHKPLVWDKEEPDAAPNAADKYRYSQLVYKVSHRGWPKQEGKLGLWLDKMLEGQWADKLQQAVTLDPGLLLDPRRYASNYFPEDRPHRLLRDAGQVWVARAMRRVHQHNAKAALDDLSVPIKLAPHLWRHIPSNLNYEGLQMQASALGCLDRWSHEAKPDKKLLLQALDALRRQELDQPTMSQLRQANYASVQNQIQFYSHRREHGVGEELVTLSLRAPWEQERRRRLINQIAAATDVDYVNSTDWKGRGALRIAIEYELHPLSIGWSQSGLTLVRGYQLQLALMLFQLDHGKPAPALNVLVPEYLPALPINPMNDEAFTYRISEGEESDFEELGIKRLEPGQGLLSTRGHRNSTFHFVVPMMTKRP